MVLRLGVFWLIGIASIHLIGFYWEYSFQPYRVLFVAKLVVFVVCVCSVTDVPGTSGVPC